MSTARQPQPAIDPAADATAAQRRAADPARSVWVGASAGSGKTTVLTDRLLRLMLPQEDGAAAAKPERILCLTYTRAAAREMALRLNKRLGAWAAMAPDKLAHDLEHHLLGRAPRDDEITAARQLFATVIDSAGGLKIMTIHSFCASVLGRFPLEAGVPPAFRALEPEEATSLLTRARDAVLDAARREGGRGVLSRALASLSVEAGADGFDGLLAAIVRECRQLRGVQERFGAGETLYSALAASFGVDTHDADAILARAVHDDAFAANDLRDAARILLDHGNDNSDRKNAVALGGWLAAAPAARTLEFHAYAQIFLTQAGEIRKKLATVAVLRRWPAVGERLQTEAARVLALQDALKGAACARLTGDLILLGGAIYERYQDIKRAAGALDFDDLVNATLDLLSQDNIASWVMYKLDGGLDHILIDEAQDTNPEQWDVVRHLSADFFAGQATREAVNRTIFAVGDEKQSIYSFQRAAPEKFRAMREHFSVQVRASRRPWWTEPLNVSFRSTPAVLRFVDEVFAPDAMRAGLGLEKLAHRSHRAGDAGLVELWPLFGSPAAEAAENRLPAAPVDRSSGAERLAEHIAATLRDWLARGELLASRGRAIAPGDILILVRNRNAFVAQLIRALKARDIPVTGLDRMVLRDQLAVQDLLAAAQFALLPEDDLTLASLLKSPLIGWTEDALAAAAIGRAGNLWQAVQAQGDAALVAYLRDLIARGGAEHPYAFFSTLLQTPCPADAQSGLRAIGARLGPESFDPLDEFLNEALHFAARQIGTLQGFLHAIATDDKTIKREQEEAGHAVRIMTVHGAKGLEAPIVILPDTVRTGRQAPNKKAERLLWPDKTGAEVPLWSPRQALDCERYAALLARQEALADEEYRRLFYVALTRAQDRLYIAGHVGAKAMLDESWYAYAQAAFARLPAHAGGLHSAAFQSPFFLPPPAVTEAPLLQRLSNPQTRIVEPAAAGTGAARAVDSAPWLLTGAPAEPTPVRPLTPSRPAAPEPPVLSPLADANADRFRRGVVTHQLLQYLPGLPAAARAAAAQGFVERQAPDLGAVAKSNIVRETLAILANPAWAALFGPEALAEVPVTGMVGDRLVSGQIDRLLVTPEELWIVDYKTNRPPPATPDQVPAAYRQQLQAYSDIVADIYPGRRVRGFLLWTQGPVLMEIEL